MKNRTRRKLAVACFVGGYTGLAVAHALGIYAIYLLQKQVREMDDWKAKTQADLFQAIADQQARGVLKFDEAGRSPHLWPVPEKRVAGERKDSE